MGEKWPKCDVIHSSLSIAEVRNEWSSTSNLPVYYARHHVLLMCTYWKKNAVIKNSINKNKVALYYASVPLPRYVYLCSKFRY